MMSLKFKQWILAGIVRHTNRLAGSSLHLFIWCNLVHQMDDIIYISGQGISKES